MTSVVATGRWMKSAEKFTAARPARPLRTSTLAPGERRNCPSVTTVSPGFSPAAMTALRRRWRGPR